MNRIFIELNKLYEKLTLLTIGTKEILTLEEAAQYLGVSKSHIYKLTSAKKIPHYSPGNKLIFFHRKELENWVTKNPIHELK